jgi:hypothetical protein
VTTNNSVLLYSRNLYFITEESQLYSNIDWTSKERSREADKRKRGRIIACNWQHETPGHQLRSLIILPRYCGHRTPQEGQWGKVWLFCGIRKKCQSL